MNIEFRNPTLDDIDAIHEIAKEYYKGYEASKEVLTGWIKDATSQFIVVEVAGEIAGCIFWEYLDEIKAIPYFHESKDYNSSKGKYAYVSEIVIAEKYKRKGLIWLLYGVLEINLKDDCKGIIWVTGNPKYIHVMEHEETEHTMIKAGRFKYVKRVKDWEYAPGKFNNSHNIYFKKIPS
jgi:hypothetical protein